MKQNIFILGANGNVGSTLVKQIFLNGDTDPTRHKNPTRIVGLASINEFEYNPRGIAQKRCYEFADKKQGTGSYDLMEILAEVSRTALDHLTFVDVTAAKAPMRDFHLEVINHTPYGIVTSNKNPVTMVSTDEFRKLASQHSRYGFRCSVMAGANAIDEILDFRDLNDPVRSIEGCFSGTLGYLCSQLQDGKTLSSVVRAAKEEGYTEPHPRDDLNGTDVAKKLLILARTAGFRAELKDIKITPFIPQSYLGIDDVGSFMDNLAGLDSKFKRDVEEASAKGKVLRYVASFKVEGEDVRLEVGPQLVPYLHPLGLLRGTDNKIVIETSTYNHQKPCIIQAPGAGLEVTAQNVRRDLLKQLRRRIVMFMSNLTN